MVEKPQETGCRRIELETEGLANGTLSKLDTLGYDIEYDEEDDIYRIGDYSKEDDAMVVV